MSRNKRLPKVKIDTERIATMAESEGCYCFKGNIPMTEYCINSQNTLLVTRNNGYLIVPHNQITTLIAELQAIQADLGRIRRVTV